MLKDGRRIFVYLGTPQHVWRGWRATLRIRFVGLHTANARVPRLQFNTTDTYPQYFVMTTAYPTILRITFPPIKNGVSWAGADQLLQTGWSFHYLLVPCMDLNCMINGALLAGCLAFQVHQILSHLSFDLKSLHQNQPTSKTTGASTRRQTGFAASRNPIAREAHSRLASGGGGMFYCAEGTERKKITRLHKVGVMS